MFLHWLAGMIFIFYLASFVMLLREVLRPGVLWFLRNLNDQNFHPINEVQELVHCMHACLYMYLYIHVLYVKGIILPARMS